MLSGWTDFAETVTALEHIVDFAIWHGTAEQGSLEPEGKRT